MPKRAPKVVDRKLGREHAVGQYEFGTRQIEIDPRQSSRDRLDTVIHEALHYCHPAMSENAVTETANAISAALWRDRWRRVEK